MGQVTVGQRLLRVDGEDVSTADETDRVDLIRIAMGDGNGVTLVLQDDADGLARAVARTQEGHAAVGVSATADAPQSSAQRSQQDAPHVEHDHEGHVQHLENDGDALQVNEPWFHGISRDKEVEKLKLRDEQGGYSCAGRFFVCEMDPDSPSYPGYVLYIATGGKPTRHKVHIP